MFFSLGPEVLVGEIAQLQCTAFGIPAPNIYWKTESGVLINGGRINIAVVRDTTGNSSSSTLTLSNVTLSDDGLFACVADNSRVLPAATFTVDLTVLCKSSFFQYLQCNYQFLSMSAVPPTLSVSFNDIEVLIGNDITLSCSSNGVHLPTITWTIPDPTSDQIVVSSNAINESFIVSRLNISTAEQEDTGNYICTAENSVGSNTADIFLQVLGICMKHWEPQLMVYITVYYELLLLPCRTS